MDSVLIIGLLAGGIRLSVTLGLAAAGEALAQRSGVLNVGLEGIMLCAAFVAAWGAWSSGSPWVGLSLALICGVVLGAIHACLTQWLHADQIVTGIAMVMLGLGLSGFLFRVSMKAQSAGLPGFRALDLGPLSTLPWVGPILFGQNILVYLSIPIVIALWWVLSKSRWGLMIQACGDNPAAADAAGISVRNVRAVCCMVGGALAGFAGAYLSIAQVNGFVENMVAGRGFIAIACVVLGRWNPLGAALAALGFGLCEALQIRLQILLPQLPFQFLVALPYVIGIAALALTARSAGVPHALGQPFKTLRKGSHGRVL